MKTFQNFLYLMMFLGVFSCKKDYERPDHFAVDLFENENNEQRKRVLSEDEASDKSLVVFKTADAQLLGKPKINNKVVYIYKIKSGRTLKPSSDSTSLPVKVISVYDMKIKSDSAVFYLVKPLSYKLLIEDFGVKYQTLPSAPVQD